MKTKSIFSVLLLGFVAVSVVFAVRKISPTTESGADQTAVVQDASTSQASTSQASSSLDAKLTESKYSAVYFHAPHRCPTCRKIESFAHEALTPEIEAGHVAWQIADYTTDTNASLVDQFKVFTSTVVLVEVRDGEVVRWKNLEEVWDHTGDQPKFTAFMDRAWSEFKAS